MAFKLDLLACVDALNRRNDANEDGTEGGGEPAGAVLDDLSRQLSAAGAPDAPLEEQLAALLGAFVAMQPAGEEMPALDRLVDLGAAEIDTLRQRAERAERELAEMTVSAEHACYERDAALARVAELEAWHAEERDERAKLQRDAAAMAEQLNAREARVQPSGDVVERLAGTAWTAALYHDSSHEPRATSALRFSDMREAVRAVVSALAAMGDEAWPTVEDVVEVVGGRMLCADRAALMSLYRSRLSPLIGPLRARVAELETERDALASRLGPVERVLASSADRAPCGVRECELCPPRRST